MAIHARYPEDLNYLLAGQQIIAKKMTSLKHFYILLECLRTWLSFRFGIAIIHYSKRHVFSDNCFAESLKTDEYNDTQWQNIFSLVIFNLFIITVFTWDPIWTHTGMWFQTGMKSVPVYSQTSSRVYKIRAIWKSVNACAESKLFFNCIITIELWRAIKSRYNSCRYEIFWFHCYNKHAL